MDEQNETGREGPIPKDTPLDEYPVPDPSAFPTLLEAMDCPRRDLLPLWADRACELLEDVTVFAALPLGVLEMPLTVEEVRSYPPNTVFAVPRREWEATVDFYNAVNMRTEYQVEREQAFLRHSGGCFAVYQFRPETGTEELTLEAARTSGLSPRMAGYDLAYTAALPEHGDVDTLERQFKENLPPDYHHRPVRNCDIIAVKQDGELKTWYLDLHAFSELNGMFEEIPLYRLGEHGECLPLYTEIPLYRETLAYAREHGEVDAWRASHEADIACRDAIDAAVSANYRDWCLDTNAAVRQVREQFGFARMIRVTGFSIRQKAWDGRISHANIQWSNSVPILSDTNPLNGREDLNMDFLIDITNPGLLDMFATAVRYGYERNRPVTVEEISVEAEHVLKNLKEMEYQNGPENRGYVVRLSPQFVSRANERDLNVLSSMMPFKSFEISPLRELYTSGLYARINGDEGRSARRRLKKPSFRRRCVSPKQKKGPER